MPLESLSLSRITKQLRESRQHIGLECHRYWQAFTNSSQARGNWRLVQTSGLYIAFSLHSISQWQQQQQLLSQLLIRDWSVEASDPASLCGSATCGSASRCFAAVSSWGSRAFRETSARDPAGSGKSCCLAGVYNSGQLQSGEQIEQREALKPCTGSA